MLTCAVSIVWTVHRRHLLPTQYWFYAALMLAFAIENVCALLVMLHQRTNELYNLYIPLEIGLLTMMAQRTLKKRWANVLSLVGGALYIIVLWEEVNAGSLGILNSRSTLLGWVMLTVLYAALLVDLAEHTSSVIWKDPRFWAYLSVVLFVGPAIPYVGLINEVYERDPVTASVLFVILDVLFFLRYSSALVAGLLLKPKVRP